MQRNARDWFGLVEHDNDTLVNKDRFASEDVSVIRDDNESKNGQPALGNGVQIAIVRPRNFKSAVTIGEYYRQGIPVIIDLEDVDHTLATRIIDFVSGLVLGLCGDMERPSRRVFLIVPAGAAILTTHDGLTEEGFFNQALRPVDDGRRHAARARGALVVVDETGILIPLATGAPEPEIKGPADVSRRRVGPPDLLRGACR